MKRTLIMFLLLVSSLLQQVQAQDRTVSGRVTDRANGQGLPGVTVLAKGTTAGASTNVDGAYSLSVPNNVTTLVFSYVGYGTQEQSIGSSSTINIALAVDSKQLSEVVVTALGLEANRDQLGTAQATVSGGALVNSGETSAITGLSGKTPGVIITRSSGDPGASANIQIRGAATITGNLQPLIVVDGIPIDNSSVGDAGVISSNGGASSNQTDGVVQSSRLNDINPDDIATMEVLKGAAAAALWGTRAANGVVVITTKKGKLGEQMHIGIRSSISFDRINKTPDLQTSYGQGAGGLYAFGNRLSWGDYIPDRKGGADGQITDPAASNYRGFVTFPDGSTRYAIANGTAANPHGGKNSQDTFDHAHEVFETGYTRDNSIQFSGGDDKSTYFVSAGNTYTKGIVKNNSDNNRTTIRANVSRQLSEKLNSSVNITYARTFSNRTQQGSNVSGIFLGGLRSPADFNNDQYYGDYTNTTGAVITGRQVSYRNPLGASDNPIYDNPNWTTRRVKNTTLVNRLVGSAEFNYRPTTWLSFLNRTGVDTYTDRRESYFPIFSGASPTGSTREDNILQTQVNNDFIIRANHSFGENVAVTALVGSNLNERRFDQISVSSISIVNPLSPPQLNNSPSTGRQPSNPKSVLRTAGVYGEVDLALLDQFFLTGTLRGEAASTFGTQTKSTFYFPSGTFAWQFTKISSLADNKLLSFGKLRVAYGSVGVQPNPYLTQTYYAPATNAYLLDSYGPSLDASAYGGGYLRDITRGNNALKPERKQEVETGVDLRFLQDRISLTASYYSNKTTDVILAVSQPYTTGYSAQYQNAATITNKGVELQLDGAVIKTPDFGFDLAANFSQNRNMVTSLAGVQSVFLNGFSGNSINSVAIQGYQLGALYGSRFQRKDDGSGLALDAEGFPQLASTNGVVGDPNPQWRGGLGATLRYKGLSLYALVDHVHNFDVWNGTRSILNTFGTSGFTGTRTTLSASEAASTNTFGGGTVASKVGQNAAYVRNADGSVTFRGTVGHFGGAPVALDEDWYNVGAGSGFGGAGEQYVENVNTTRLREVSLTYSLASQGFRNASHLQSVDFTLTARNIYLWTNYSGVDPETNLTGVSNGRGLDYFNNPSTRSLLFSLRLTY